ncbi:uncharacterized protein OCT59_013280 [Rhizophagus irregularis]|uniref:Uncharacterized protein n=2 Tax=Rhizophagus irregularis TaxID=588596 RepID=U9SST2_RHIID|nr:hypothetical protein GLOIN_2v1884558 [Rhizophagus irregularis DAOM 181602=DAOM 197198]EXX64000.1 hypothetical protein RirG_147000 [Rhizophagus irregularis DAOM 197198w]UZO20870.1 hypothetical protein OCT59_013280 [Rhizophagus irregularis]POG60113.1 hypothetical protein GLOIN_2v1884558 [Rhizophagus irregularis DAOM 181602=DAOM 197198]CAG8725001.1 12310_t:CDS:1 [Rhizophagus irregularis]GBC27650.1 hypothetical protein GLOIN_2v1884558 [Rhizophagus irregularis DAOM 181602=DAOM 197198]|eukprot:XP_025166979.1 hypothetical protein GLOIN_2v1884558 [Rhizophagus irregularis DAOM 181602=DAOM 197198]
MNHNTLQNNQNNSTFTEFSNLQSTVIQPIQPVHSLNINYNDVNVNSSDNNFPTYYTNTHYLDQQPTSNENISTPIASSYAPQYVGPQQTTENTLPLNLFNMTNVNPSQSQILSFDIPGFKIIVIPTSSQQQDNTYLNHSSDISDTQFTQFQQ